jgi:DNA mismatch repair ATPase MutS
MKAFLLFRDHDFEPDQKLPWSERTLIPDLALDILFRGMANRDEFLFSVAKVGILSSLSNDLETILYRQSILKDCLRNPTIVRELYALAVEGVQCDRKCTWGIFSKYPAGVLGRAVELLQYLIEVLKKLRTVAEQSAVKFESEGFRTLFAMLQAELSDEYFASIRGHLKELKFRAGVLISADLGQGNKGKNYVLREPLKKQHWFIAWLQHVFGIREPGYTFFLDPRDENGARALSELNERGINLVANALAQSTDHILNFFKMLRTEVAFYVGCLNLQEQLAKKGEPICFPEPAPGSERKHSGHGLYDVCLSLCLRQKVVGNDLNADGKDLVIITGANQGGKSTFLRSIGLAQLMMQAGMFVSAESFSANICSNLFTHYKREEDATMKSGKFDEELKRMSEIVDHLTPDSTLLFNESFAATNEREGSEIAGQIVSTLIDKGLKVFFVTHLYTFAQGFYEDKTNETAFLRAERKSDGTRTFKLVEAEPLQTSYGEDLYNQVFAGNVQRASVPPSPSDSTGLAQCPRARSGDCALR